MFQLNYLPRGTMGAGEQERTLDYAPNDEWAKYDAQPS